MSDALQLVSTLPGRAVELLAVYARFEFSLKDLGWCQPGRNDAVEARWDDFANERLGKAFFDHAVKSGQLKTLLHEPPSVQVVLGKMLDWRESSPPKSVQDLIGAVRRVRNNLAHGGKSGSPDRERDVRLIEEALTVLLMAVAWDDVFEHVFEGQY